MNTRQWLLPALLIVMIITALHRLTLASDVPAGAAGLAGLPVSELVIATAAGPRHRFRVYEARRPEERSRGLMYVTELARDEGMIFDSGETAHAAMWMRNTPLSLDMLFLLEDGTIARIEHETVPHSRKLIPSGVPVRAVLEINGGVAADLGIDAGDRVIHPIFASPEPATGP